VDSLTAVGVVTKKEISAIDGNLTLQPVTSSAYDVNLLKHTVTIFTVKLTSDVKKCL
jgi:hypothetical protein